MWKQVLIILISLIAGAFLWWAFSPLLFDTEVNDALPTTSSTISVADDASILPTPETEVSAESGTSKREPQNLTSEPAERLYPITGTTGHPAEGNIRVVLTPEEKIIRFEDYDGTNGPDLKIYLSKDLEADDFIDLGPSRANQGNINYAVPMNVDIDEYQYVLTWCEAFGVLFDYAEIN